MFINIHECRNKLSLTITKSKLPIEVVKTLLNLQNLQ